MRVLSAHYAWNGESGFVKNPLLFLNHQHEVVELVEQGSHYKEYAGTEFFSGLLIPSFLNIIELKECVDKTEIIKILNLMHLSGSLFVSVEQSNYDSFVASKQDLPKIYQYSDKRQKCEFESLISSIPTWEKIKYEVANGVMGIDDLLQQYITKAFKSTGLDEVGGSFAIGKTPGVLLLTGIDWSQMSFTNQVKMRLIETP